MNAVKHVLFFLMFLVSFSTQAVEVVFELGVHAGGDEITTAATSSGDQTVTAGGGISAAVGAKIDMSDTLSMQLTFGFKEDAINGSNGNIKFSRNTLDMLFHSKLGETLSLGVGPTWHSSVKLTADGVGAFYVQDTDFDDALGLLVDAKFDVGEPGDFFLAVRLTFIEYESKQSTLSKKTFSGNSLGLIWGGNF